MELEEAKEVKEMLSGLVDSIIRIRVAERNEEFERKVQQHLNETYEQFVKWVKEKECQELADAAHDDWLRSQSEME